MGMTLVDYAIWRSYYRGKNTVKHSYRNLVIQVHIIKTT